MHSSAGKNKQAVRKSKGWPALADFEGLIRQALSVQNSADAATRQRVYQSSRNALARMLEKSGQGDDAVRSHFRRLENAIALVEAEFLPPAPPPVSAQPQTFRPETAAPQPAAAPQTAPPQTAPPQGASPQPVPQPSPRNADQGVFGQAPRTVAQPREPQFDTGASTNPSVGSAAGPLSGNREPVWRGSEPGYDAGVDHAGPYEPGYDPDFADDAPDVDDFTPTYRRKHPLARRLWPLLLAIAVILVLLWIFYALFVTMQGGAADGQAQNNAPVGEAREADDGSVYITLLQPTDLSALTTAGRGSAQLVGGQNQQLLRIQSQRPDDAFGDPAEPIRLDLERGVLRQLPGKEVTVEINAKSGSSGPAQFAVECFIDGASACGRKRFRLGLQPEKIVFALDVPSSLTDASQAYLAINTDVTNAANATGAGDPLDIIYVRMRLTDG